MKNTTTSVLGFDVPVSNVPETLPEGITAAGGEQNFLDQWNAYIKFHRTNTEARSAVVDALEEVTGIKRETETVKSPTKAEPNRTVEKYSESEQQYADRVAAQLSQTREQLWQQISTKVGTLEFKAVGEPRIGGPGKLAKVYTTNAQTLIAAGPEKFNAAIALLQQKNPGLEVALDANGVPTVESLAAALKQNKARADAEENAALGIAA